MADINLQAIITAKDLASKTVKGLGNAVSNLGERLKTDLKYGAIAGAAGLAAIIKASANFEKSMANVATLVDTNVENMEEMSKEVQAMAKRMPVPINELSTALYQVRSAGIEAAGAMDVLEASAKLAVAGLGTTEEATNLVTSAINAFGLDATRATKHADVFFRAVKAGKTTVAELAQGFGQIAPLASEVGVQFEELMAITSAMTTSGLTASIAYSQQRAMISNLLKPTAEMQELFDKLNITNIQTKIQQDGLIKTTRELAAATEGNNEMLAKAFGSVEALNAVMMILGDTGENAIEITKGMTSATTELNEAYEKQLETFEANWQILKNSLNVEMIRLGNEILPPLTAFMKNSFIPTLEGVASYFRDHTTMLNIMIGLLLTLGAILNVPVAALGLLAWAIYNVVRAIDEFIGLIKDVYRYWVSKLTLDITNLRKAFEDLALGASISWGKVKGFLGLQAGGIMPYTGMAMLHKGERVTPAGMFAGGGEVTINFYGNINNTSQQSLEDIGRILARQISLSRMGV